MIQKSKSVSPMSNEGRNAYVIEHINEALLGLDGTWCSRGI